MDCTKSLRVCLGVVGKSVVRIRLRGWVQRQLLVVGQLVVGLFQLSIQPNRIHGARVCSRRVKADTRIDRDVWMDRLAHIVESLDSFGVCNVVGLRSPERQLCVAVLLH